MPLTLVVLGAYFHVPDETTVASKSLMQRIRDIRYIFRHKESPVSQKNETKPGETKSIILAIASRMIITPLILIPGMALATWYNWHEIFQE